MTGPRRPPRGMVAHAGDRSPSAHRGLLAVAVTAVALCSLVATGTAQAAETAKLAIGFAPYRLGVNSAFTFAVQLGSTTGGVPSPATSIGLRMPAGMGLSTSQLGLSVCQPEALRAGGVAGCPPEAVMGRGSALAVEAMGSEQIEIPTAVTVVMGPSVHEQTRLYFYAEAQSVVITELLFAGYLTGMTKPLGTLVDANTPPTVGVPGTPPAALIKLAVTLAPRGLMYVKRVHGRTVRYHPKGLAVPAVCPPGGFPFGVKLGFADGTSTEATTRVACPDSVGHSGSRRHGRARGAREHSGQGRRGK